MAVELKDGSYILSKQEYYDLMNISNIYDALRCAGVDNWSGWGEHWEFYDSSYDPDWEDDE